VQVGDGDCGTTVKAGGEAVLAKLDSIDFSKPADAASALAAAVAAGMGGTSGALYHIFFTAAAISLRSAAGSPADTSSYVAAFAAGVAAIQRYGRAQEGDRTMVDAMAPASAAASSAGQGAVSCEHGHADTCCTLTSLTTLESVVCA
jgi:triose/dihydroxyacetone kinase / FAD-AMP lyase (cyclizing)